MMRLLLWEWRVQVRRPGWYALLAALLALGVLAGAKATFSALPMVHANGTYNIAYFTGMLSLLAIFWTTLLGAQHLFKDRDHHFAQVLHAAPVGRWPLLGSRLMLIWGLSSLYLVLMLLGFAAGQALASHGSPPSGPVRVWHYLQPALLFVLPNAFYCTAFVCACAWLTRNKVLVYGSGLGLYIAYMASLLFSGSPVLAGSYPVSAEAMQWSALCDPFGISAFYQQTMHWSALQRNAELVQLHGFLGWNRLAYAAVSIGCLALGIWRFQPMLVPGGRLRRGMRHAAEAPAAPMPGTAAVPTRFGIGAQCLALGSLLRVELKVVFRGVAFWLILAGVLFYLAMELHSSIDRGIRLPAQYASTALMVNTLLPNLPGLCLPLLLFYGHELIGRRRQMRFEAMESVLPLAGRLPGLTRWMVLVSLVAVVLIAAVLLGILFQFLHGYGRIEWRHYAALVILAGLPLALVAAWVLAVLRLFRQSYVGLGLAGVAVLLFGTGFGRVAGLGHPLWRFAQGYGGELSEMNGWGDPWLPFGWRLLFGAVLLLALGLLLAGFQHRKKWLFAVAMVAGILSAGIGCHLHRQIDFQPAAAKEAWRADYEHRYRIYQGLPNPTITAVSVQVDLFPAAHAYHVQGQYTLQNQGLAPLDSVLIYLPVEVAYQSLSLEGGTCVLVDSVYGHRIVRLRPAIKAGECRTLEFAFRYQVSPFQGQHPMNAIVENGSFIRLSNYFPAFGYQPDLALTDLAARQQHRLGPPTALLALDAPRTPLERVELDLRLSTSADQRVMGIGDLVSEHVVAGRRNAHFRSGRPVPLRFGVASGRYAVARDSVDGILIEVDYHPSHPENVPRLIARARQAMRYCQAQFGPYPYPSLRFVEVSSRTKGFAGTAYPGTVFMTEDIVFHADLSGAPAQDVINELAAHELSHMWWGGAQVMPDAREGAQLMTETLAMYTELMCAKAQGGLARVLALVDLQRGLYLSERGFAAEVPLLRTTPGLSHLHYAKGLVTMHQLTMLIGEDRVNAALRDFLARQRESAFAPVATDLLQAFYAVSDSIHHARITDMFCRVVTHAFKVEQARLGQTPAGFVLDLRVSATRHVEDGHGKRVATPLADSLEIGLYDAQGHIEIRKLAIPANSGAARWHFQTRPARMALDPRRVWLQDGEAVAVELVPGR